MYSRITPSAGRCAGERSDAGRKVVRLGGEGEVARGGVKGERRVGRSNGRGFENNNCFAADGAGVVAEGHHAVVVGVGGLEWGREGVAGGGRVQQTHTHTRAHTYE